MKKLLTLLLCAALLLSTLCVFAGASQEQTSTADTSAATEQGGTTTLPKAANYLFVNPGMGYASGTLSFDMPEQSNATSFALYWGDENGVRIPGMKPLMTGEIISPTMSIYPTEAFAFPAQAKSMLLYTYSEQYGESATPIRVTTSVDTPQGHINYTLPETGKQLAEYVIVSDIHIGAGKTAEKNFSAMLADVVKTAPDAAGIIVVGDAVEAAEKDFYEQLKQLYAKTAGAPPMYLGVGDRSYLTKGTYDYDAAKHQANLQTFLQYAGHPFGQKLEKPYYSYSLGGTLMVFIGADSYQNGNAVYSEEQLTWLSGILENAEKYEPVFLFMHEPMANTISGSYDVQGYGNVDANSTAAIRTLLREHKNVITFTGHTQYALEADKTNYPLSNGIYHTGGIAHLWTDKDGAGYEVAGSQGYYVTVYEDAVLIRGRDFATGEWITSAFYMFSTKPYIPPTPTTPQTVKPATTKKPAEEQSTEEAEEKESSLRDLIPPLCILGGMSVVVFIFIFRKPKEQA